MSYTHKAICVLIVIVVACGAVALLSDDPEPKLGKVASRHPSPTGEPRAEEKAELPARTEVERSKPQTSTSELVLTKDQRKLVKRLCDISRKTKSDVFANLIAADSEFAKSLSQAVDEASKGVNEAMLERERLKGKILRHRISVGRFEQLAINKMYDDPKHGELIVSMCEHDPATGKDIRKLVRIYPGQEPELDLARTSLMEEKRLRRMLIEQMVSHRLKR